MLRLSFSPNYAQELDIYLILISRRELSYGVYTILFVIYLTAYILIINLYYLCSIQDGYYRIYSSEMRYIVCVCILAIRLLYSLYLES